MKIPECLDDYTRSHTLPSMFCTPTFPGSSASRKPGLRKQFTSNGRVSSHLHPYHPPRGRGQNQTTPHPVSCTLMRGCYFLVSYSVSPSSPLLISSIAWIAVGAVGLRTWRPVGRWRIVNACFGALRVGLGRSGLLDRAQWADGN